MARVNGGVVYMPTVRLNLLYIECLQIHVSPSRKPVIFLGPCGNDTLASADRYTALLSEKCLILFRTQILQIFLVFSHFFDLHCFHEFFETDEIELAELSKKPPVFNTAT